MKIEHKLDWTLLRKKAEINDALGRPTRVRIGRALSLPLPSSSRFLYQRPPYDDGSFRLSERYASSSRTQPMTRHGSSSNRETFKVTELAYQR